jgi:hypothetical protein
LGKEKNTARKFGGIIRTRLTPSDKLWRTAPWCPCSTKGATWCRRWTASTIDTFFDLVSEPLTVLRSAPI